MINRFSKFQQIALVLTRVLVGWHFLYEGLAKVLSPGWTSLPYLMDSQGIFSKLFQGIATNPSLLSGADFLNQWGLILVGLGLILGCFTRVAAAAGMLMLAFFIMSHPSFIGVKFALPSEGSYLWVDKNVIEFFVLMLFLAFPTGQMMGIDQLICKKCKN